MTIPYKAECMADGIHLLGIHSEFNVGTWVFESGGECAVMEMPEGTEGEPHPSLQVSQFIKDKGWNLKYLLLSHPHLDHLAGIDDYRNQFPNADFSVHYSVPLFLRISEHYWGSGKGQKMPDIKNVKVWENIKRERGLQWFLSFFNRILPEDINTLKLGGEPLYMIYGPKHSLADMHHIFKGVWFPGDWWMGKGDPCVDRASSSKAVDSIERLVNFCDSINYKIHSIFPAHANNMMKNIDFKAVLKETSDYHKQFDADNVDDLGWKDFCIRTFYYYTFQKEFKK